MQSSQTEVAKAIRLHLAATRQSQNWLAKQIGVRAAYLSDRMTGKRNFTTDDLDAIADVFGTDLAGLLVTAKAVA